MPDLQLWVSDEWWDCSLHPNYVCKDPRWPGCSSCAKPLSITIKFLNLCKVISIQVSKHASALKAQKTTTLFPRESSKASLSMQVSVWTGLYRVTGITGEVVCLSNALVFQGTVLVMDEGNLLNVCQHQLSVMTTRKIKSHRKVTGSVQCD